MNERNPDVRISDLIAERWSPRSFDGTAVPEEHLHIIFEAAALAPSAFNVQPWRLIYAIRDDENWSDFLSLLIPFNASWAKDAGALLFIVSDRFTRKGDDKRANDSHSFDAGAAWALMALQATHMGYHAHAMTGIKHDEVARHLAIPDDYRLEAAVVIGRRAPADRLPEGLRDKEKMSGRNPVSDIAWRGRFRPAQ